MSRIYDRMMVVLPRVTGTESALMCRELITRADEQRGAEGVELPPDILRSLRRMTVAHQKLVQAKVPVTVPVSDEALEADKAVDNAWRSVNSWLYGWTLASDDSHPLLPKARALYQVLFGDGMTFINDKFGVEWQESQFRLEAIVRDGYEATIDALGGRVLLDRLRLAQKKYGDVLGVTTVNDPVAAKTFEAEMEALLNACREYVGRVALYPDEELPGSEPLARKLLEPVESWESQKATAKSATATPAAPERSVPPPVASQPAGGSASA